MAANPGSELSDSGPTTAETARRWLPRVALVETLTVVVLFGNLLALQIEEVASLIGPLHGTAYLATIACAFGAALSRTARLLSIVPVVGGLLAIYAARREALD